MIKLFPYLLLVLALAGCRKKEDGFEMSYRRTFELPIGLDNFRSHTFEFKDIACDTSVFFKANSATATQITRIEPATMNLRATFGGTDNRYNIIEQIEVRIFDPSRPSLTPQIVFFRDNVPVSTGNRLDLVPNNVDVRPFLIDGNRFNVKINMRLRAITDRSVDTEWNMNFFAFN